MSKLQTLEQRQAAFMRAILDEAAPLPDGWGNRQALGMSVYRGNYRSALVSALENTFERTARYIGEDTFKKICAHHAIAHPPAGWTIDEAGEGFDATCAELFANNPEVADLAWLEWAMLSVSTAEDAKPLTPGEFAASTGEFDDEDWTAMRLRFQPCAEAKVVETNLIGLWNALDQETEGDRPPPRLDASRGVIVSREDERPTFQMVDSYSARAFDAMQNKATYGEAIMLLVGDDPAPEAVQQAAMRAGALLGEWLRDGLVVGLDA